jgi:WhiB family redox-sensing transcriptional regulator
MEHTDAGVRTPPVGLRTREEDEHDRTAVGRPATALGPRPGVLGATRPPAPRTPADTHATAELRVATPTSYAGRVTPDAGYELVRPAPGSAQPLGYATTRRVEAVAVLEDADARAEDTRVEDVTAQHAATEADELDTDDDDTDDGSADDVDDELEDDDELPGPGQPGDVPAGGASRPVLAEVIDIGLGDLLGEVMEWQERALCAQTDPEAFFPEKGGSTREAKRICSGCEVRTECLEYALANDERFGIWGGMSERERRKQRRRAV